MIIVGVVGALLLAAGAQGFGIRVDRMRRGEGSGATNAAGAAIGLVAAILGGGLLLLVLLAAVFRM